MHSVTLDSSGSPKKWTLSRGMSEDESLRSIIKETDSSSRRLTRSDSRAGTLKKRSNSQSEQELFMGLPEMLELQASYDEVVQELRGLEVEREALLFQVDVLQDTLEGVEELLAEAQREAGQANLELEQERENKRKLESMVCSLMQEVERLKEERNNEPHVPANTHGHVDEVTRQEMKNNAKALMKTEHREEKDSSLCEAHSSQSRASEEDGQSEKLEDEGSFLTKLRKMVGKSPSHLPSLALDNPVSEDGVLRRPYENGVEVFDGLHPSSDGKDSDSISAYEDASAETPEQDRMFPGEADTLELPHDSENKEKLNNCQANDRETQDPKNPDVCVMS
ncbi:leucine-rich repeat flightless-interacting protein 1 isoform X2 [Micropterus dolomieu]|uniref:leucine-rich repeat flightless-interacting protein 1 isoform X2 n=1 Tax=Micropterus dolomieu TaxID=147949 RepID=UPI001E8CE19D|nr:leucine-rich repeat flightless-interacting protein 1 isoform X2 [Micropterus dolomieu]